MILIGVGKLLKAALLFTLALGAHHLLYADVQQTVDHWAREVRVDPANEFVHSLLSRVTGLSPRRLQEIALGTLLYGTLFATEGVGLLLRKRWAEYLTVVTTAGLMPIEVYEVLHVFRWAKLVVLAVNIAIVAYLILVLRRNPPKPR